MNKPSPIIAWLFYFIVLAWSPLATAAKSEGCSATEYADLRKAIKDRFPGWTLVTTTTLSEDDRRLWDEKRKGKCPGIAKGDFSGSGKLQYAVLLVSKKATKATDGTYATRSTKLLHASSEDYGDLAFTMMEDGVTTLTPVIFVGRPGTYHYFKPGSDKRASIRVTTDLVLMEVMESSLTAYYFSEGAVKSLAMSF